MKRLEDYNPTTIFLYFLAVTVVPTVFVDPALAALSLSGAAAYYILRGQGRLRDFYVYGGLLLAMALINPLFRHNGVTVLFVMGNNPITLEATIYGFVASSMILSVILWFSTFSRIMTSEKLLYLFGRVSPKLALILSMALRYIPLFSTQAKRVGDAQKVLGLYKEDNIIDDIRGGARVFGVMVSWALENGIITADSMAARGYGIGRRSSFAIYKFTRADAALLLMILTLFGAAAGVSVLLGVSFTFYPAIKPPPSLPAAAVYSAYALLSFLPAALEVWECVKWKYLLSKI
ncbi:MAG TPA: cobalt transport protein [Clostridiales bacterium]|nr:cobalt transport protein [Clostridiales bacterium]